MLGRELHGLAVGEVLLDVGVRSVEALLLAAPEREADGAVHFEVERFEDASRFHDHGAAGGVVGGAGAAVPGVEVGAQHDDLVLLAAAGDFGDHVEGIMIAFIDFVLNVELKLDRDFVVDQAGDAVVMLGGEDGGGDGKRALGIFRSAGHGEHSAAVAAVGEREDRAFIL